MPAFTELALILIITTSITIIARLLRQPLVVGYILSGIVVGPYLLDILHAADELELFSKIGISVLLFIVGINLNPEIFRETGKTSVIAGVGQVLFTSGTGFLLTIILGFDVLTALYVAVALTFSSTIIILKILSDKGDLGKLSGRLAIGILLVQDLIATLLLIIIPIVGAKLGLNAAAEHSATFADLFLKGAGAGLLLFAVSKYVLPRLSFFLARSQELLFLFSISWGLALAALFAHIGFSIEIGALIAGVTLSVSSYAFEISSRLRPLRDFFIVLFFVLLGARLGITNITALFAPAATLSFFVLVGNPLIVFVLLSAMGYRPRTAFLVGLTVAQVSEFSLILMALGLSLGHVTAEAVSLVTIVGLITITASTYLIMYADQIYAYLKKPLGLLVFRKHPHRDHGDHHAKIDMVIFGFGRVGHEFVRTAKEIGMRYLVVDFDPAAVRHLEGENIPYRFGDADDVEFLDEIALTTAGIVISTIPDPNVNLLLIRHYRRTNPGGIVIAVSHDIPETKELYVAGASYVVMPHYLGAEKASDMIAKHHDDPGTFVTARNRQLAQIRKSEEEELRPAPRRKT